MSPGVTYIPWEAAAAEALQGPFPELWGRCEPGEPGTAACLQPITSASPSLEEGSIATRSLDTCTGQMLCVEELSSFPKGTLLSVFLDDGASYISL